MPVPNAMSDLSQLPGSNYPVGSEAIGNNLDNYLRAHAALIRQSNAVASSTMPSGSTVNVALSDGEAVVITGDAFISSLGVGFAGCRRELHLSGNAHFIHSSALQLPAAGNIDGSPGQIFTFRCISPSVWVLTSTTQARGFLGQWANLDPGSYQAALGFTPVQQGGGEGMLNNKIILGWDASGSIRAQVDALPLGFLTTASDLAAGLAGKASLSGAAFTGAVSVLGPVTSSGAGAELVFNARDTATAWSWYAVGGEANLFRAGSGNLLAVDSSGNLVTAGNITAFSDVRLKSNIRPIAGALDLVKRLQGVRYIKDGQESIGFVAQDYGDVLPELRHVGADGMQSVAYGNTVAVLAEAIKELAELVESR